MVSVNQAQKILGWSLAGFLCSLPTRFSGLGGDLPALFLGHGLQAALAPDLSSFAAYGSHVLGEASGRRLDRRGFWFWNPASGAIDNPLR
jgi:hypothetical protein